MTSRRSKVTNAMRARIFLAWGGTCHLCGLKIDTTKQQFQIDHIQGLWIAGNDTEDNMAPAHVHCHVGKTSVEAPVRAKSDRIIKRRLGLRKRQSRPMPGSKASGWKHKLDGTWERR